MWIVRYLLGVSGIRTLTGRRKRKDPAARKEDDDRGIRQMTAWIRLEEFSMHDYMVLSGDFATIFIVVD